MTLARRVFALIGLSALALSGCGKDSDAERFGGGRFCTTNLVSGLRIEVANETGAPLNFANVTVRDGDFTEVLAAEEDFAPVASRNGRYHGVLERAGVYSVTVTAPGYVPQSFSGVSVTRDECHVKTEEFSVVMKF